MTMTTTIPTTATTTTDGGGDHHPPRRKRRSRRTEAARFGDDDQALAREHYYWFDEEKDKASWGEIYQTCCVHSAEDWGWLFVGLICLIICLYLALLGFHLLGEAAQVVFGCRASALFDRSNPLEALMMSILATILMQSSGATIAVVVALMESGTISVSQGIYMVMGSNIGTCFTADVVALAHFRNPVQLERAFTAAAVHDMFNVMTTLVLFPLELVSGFMKRLTEALATDAETGPNRRDEYQGFVKRIVAPFSNRIIMVNKKAIFDIAGGRETCDSIYPIDCDPALEASYATCHPGLIACDKVTGRCPAFFRESATREQDQVAGGISLCLALVLLFLGMTGLLLVMQRLLHGMTVKVVYTATHCNGYIGILVGIGITMLVQYSSLTASTLVQLAALGAIRVEQLYPLVIGANIGTTLQGIITSMSKHGTRPLQVALSHLFINIASFLLWYPIPHTRAVITWPAQRLGHGAALWPYFSVIYIVGMYFAIPLLLIGLSACFTHAGTAGVVVGSLLTILFTVALIGLIYWCKFKGGDTIYLQWVQQQKQPEPPSAPSNSGSATAEGVGRTDHSRSNHVSSVTTKTTTTMLKDKKENAHDLETGGNGKHKDNNSHSTMKIAATGENHRNTEKNGSNTMPVVHGNDDDDEEMGDDQQRSTLPESALSAIHGGTTTTTTMMATIREEGSNTSKATDDWDSASIENILAPVRTRLAL